MTDIPAAETLTTEILIEALPEEIWPFLTESRKFARWMGEDVLVDPVPGGVHRVAVSRSHVAEGRYLSIEPFTRVVFTFGWRGDDSTVPIGSSTVEITLHPDGPVTLVRLAHRDLPIGGAAGHSEGWNHYLARLAIVAAGGDAGLDPWSVESS